MDYFVIGSLVTLEAFGFIAPTRFELIEGFAHGFHERVVERAADNIINPDHDGQQDIYPDEAGPFRIQCGLG